MRFLCSVVFTRTHTNKYSHAVVLLRSLLISYHVGDTSASKYPYCIVLRVKCVHGKQRLRCLLLHHLDVLNGMQTGETDVPSYDCGTSLRTNQCNYKRPHLLSAAFNFVVDLSDRRLLRSTHLLPRCCPLR